MFGISQVGREEAGRVLFQSKRAKKACTKYLVENPRIRSIKDSCLGINVARSKYLGTTSVEFLPFPAFGALPVVESPGEGNCRARVKNRELYGSLGYPQAYLTLVPSSGERTDAC